MRPVWTRVTTAREELYHKSNLSALGDLLNEVALGLSLAEAFFAVDLGLVPGHVLQSVHLKGQALNAWARL